MSTVLSYLGTLCTGLTLAVLVLYLLVCRIEGARAPGDGFVFFLLGMGPMAVAITCYLLAWQLLPT